MLNTLRIKRNMYKCVLPLKKKTSRINTKKKKKKSVCHFSPLFLVSFLFTLFLLHSTISPAEWALWWMVSAYSCQR